MNPDNLTAEEASANAAHQAKTAQEAVEQSREVHLQEAIQKTALETKAALLEGLKEVFGEGDEHNSSQMRVLVRRIPILCQDIKAMHEDIAAINDNLKWAVRLVIGAILLAVVKLVLIP